MKKWFNNNKLYVAGALVGAIAGFLYWQNVGCSTGTCMITSRPVNSTVYGALLGSLLFGIFKKEEKKQTSKEDKKSAS